MEQINVEALVKAGIFPIITVLAPGVQGATVAGTQGVGTPSAAVVRMLQVPKGRILSIGTLSMMFAAGRLDALTVFLGSTIRVEGAVPIGQVNMAPLQTN